MTPPSLRGLLHALKQRLANWLLSGVELEELRVRSIKTGERTVTLGNHINVGGGRIINIGSRNVSFDAEGVLDLAGIPDTLTGKDADSVDGKHASDLLDKATYDPNDDGVVEEADYAVSATNASRLGDRPADDYILRDGSHTMQGDFRADTDNAYCLGLDTYRWSDIYAVNTHFGDIGFRERTCVKCGRAFEVGDDIVLRVIRFDEGSGDMMAVPIHARCVEKPKVKVRRMMPVKEERWIWDEQRGEFVKVLANKTVARKVKVKRPKLGYIAEDGKFWKVENGRRVEVTAEEALEEAEVEVREVVYEEKEFEV